MYASICTSYDYNTAKDLGLSQHSLVWQDRKVCVLERACTRGRSDNCVMRRMKRGVSPYGLAPPPRCSLVSLAWASTQCGKRDSSGRTYLRRGEETWRRVSNSV
jgi:hypothetical protein